MIFLTVGTQLPFDRLIEIVDNYPKIKSFPVVCQNCNGLYVPRNFSVVNNLTLDAYNKIVTECSVIISHAGMGSILTAMQYQKPVIILPRLLALNEIRSEHQVPTAKAFSKSAGIYSVFEPQEIYDRLDNIESLTSSNGISESQQYSSLKNYFKRTIL